MYTKTERQQLITEKIISSVYSNHLKNGDRMPSENQLAAALDVSRVSVREVYAALELIGIVESRRGEGTFLKTDGGSDNMIFRLMLLALYNDTTDVSDVMEIRKVIETGMAEMAAAFRSDEDVKLLKKIIREMKTSADGSSLSRLDNELHAAIGAACGNTLLCSLSNMISSLIASSIKEHWNYIAFDSRQDTRQNTFEQHRELVEAIINKKPDTARQIMQQHLEFVSASLDRYKREFADYEDEIKQRARVSELSHKNDQKKRTGLNG